MTATKTDSIISRINKLLALAMDPSASEHERKLAQERADRLMVQNQIDRMDLTVEERGKVVEDTWSFESLDHNFRGSMISLADAIVRHCGCRAVYGGYDKININVVGFPEDISYSQNLWSVVFLELVGNMFPVWDGAKGLDANVYAFVKAGYKWREIHEIAFKNGAEGIPNPYPEGDGWWPKYVPDGGKLGRAYRRELKRIGEAWSPNTSRHLAYRTSYVQSFSSTIASRLAEIRRKSKDEINDEDRYRLAVRSTEEQVLAEFYRLHPDYDPEVQKRRAEEWRAKDQARRAKLTPEERLKEDQEAEKERQRAFNHYKKMRDSQHDPAGWARGDEVARSVDLNNNKKFDEKDEIGPKMGELA